MQAKLYMKTESLKKIKKHLKASNYISESIQQMSKYNGILNFKCILYASFCNKNLEKVNITSHGGESKTNNLTCDPEKWPL